MRLKPAPTMMLALLFFTVLWLGCNRQQGGEQHARQIKAEIVYYAIPG